MDSAETFRIGIRFPIYDMEELELLTDLLAIKEQHLDVLLAVASYLHYMPHDRTQLRTVLRRRIEHSRAALLRAAKFAVMDTMSATTA